ncbi:MAG: LamG-like jellyroll fold domain-containing protein [Algibacter sp.]
MKKTLLLIFTISAFMNLNAQDFTSNLVFHLNGDETITTNSLTSSDASAATGTVLGGTITHTTGVDGSANGAFNIPADTYISFPAGDINNLPLGGVGTTNGVVNPSGSDRTYAAWVKGTVLNGNILSYGSTNKAAGGTNGRHVHLHLEDNGTDLKMGHYSLDFVYTGLSYSGGDWHHIVCKVYEASSGGDVEEVELFIDGVSQGAITQNSGSENFMDTTITEANFTHLTVGMRNTATTGSPSKDFVGEMDEIRIYNRALTTADIQALYAANSTLSTPTIDKVTDFAVFPTITSDVLEVKSNVQLKQLSIVNITGTTIRRIKANETVNVSNLSSGLYFIVGQSDNGVSTIKFVKK